MKEAVKELNEKVGALENAWSCTLPGLVPILIEAIKELENENGNITIASNVSHLFWNGVG